MIKIPTMHLHYRAADGPPTLRLDVVRGPAHTPTELELLQTVADALVTAGAAVKQLIDRHR